MNEQRICAEPVSSSVSLNEHMRDFATYFAEQAPLITELMCGSLAFREKLDIVENPRERTFIANSLLLEHLLLNLQARHSCCDLDRLFLTIEGWLSINEGLALLLFAAKGSGNGAVVEIGSFKGRSTAFLASGLMLADRGRVTAIDHFGGSTEHQVGAFEEVREIVESGTTYPVYERNLKSFELWNHVSTIKAETTVAAAGWNKPIRMLFLDAEHTYDATKQVFDLFSPWVEENGFVCFHDAINPVWPDVGKFYAELITHPDWQAFLTVDTMRLVRRRSR